MAFSARQGFTAETEPERAVADIVRQIGAPDLDAVFFFCSPRYDLPALGRELQRAFACPVIGCSSAGQIGQGGFQRGGMNALGLGGGQVRVVPQLIQPLADYQVQANRVAAAFRDLAAGAGEAHGFGLLLVDGLSMMEERLTSALYQALDNIPIIGGSAGDDLRFQRTQVYFDGQFRSDAAVLAACLARGPIAPFMLGHFVPTGARLVITDSDEERRIIREFNGEPAASAYAEAIGADPAALGPELFSRHPLLLGIGGEQYVRAIARVHADQSLALYCAIETGLVVTIGQSIDPVAALERALEGALARVQEPVAILVCDCILRRLEFENLGIDQRVGALMARHRVFGFSTYGEQFNGVHLNQTLTGIVLGASREDGVGRLCLRTSWGSKGEHRERSEQAVPTFMTVLP